MRDSTADPNHRRNSLLSARRTHASETRFERELVRIAPRTRARSGVMNIGAAFSYLNLRFNPLNTLRVTIPLRWRMCLISIYKSPQYFVDDIVEYGNVPSSLIATCVVAELQVKSFSETVTVAVAPDCCTRISTE